MNTNKTLSELLLALGFKQMAQDVLTETDAERIRRYVKVIIKTSPEAQRWALIKNFRLLNLY